MIKRLTLIAALLALPAFALAQHAEHAASAPTKEADHHAAASPSAHTTLEYNHPTLSPYTTPWAGALLIIIAGMFLAAAVIGPVIRSEMPEEVPDAHSHDEPPGTSGHHGHSGTHTPTPDHHH